MIEGTEREKRIAIEKQAEAYKQSLTIDAENRAKRFMDRLLRQEGLA